MRIDKNLKVNTKAFLEIVSEMFSEWIPDLAGVGIQAVWAGYYTEPRYIVDPELGLFVGMRGHGFMLSQYIARMNRAVSKMVEEALKYNQVESVLESGEEEDIFSPEYFEKLKLNGPGLSEKAFK